MDKTKFIPYLLKRILSRFLTLIIVVAILVALIVILENVVPYDGYRTITCGLCG